MNGITVIGIGRIGLPLALMLASTYRNQRVYGVDSNPKQIEQIKSGKVLVKEDLAQDYLDTVLGKNFFPTTDLKNACQNSDTFIITLGTPTDEHMNPDISAVIKIIDALISNLKIGDNIILRSTISPGVTDYVRKHIESKTQFKVGKDVFLSHCPERILEGKAITEYKTIPQIVGAFDDESSRKASELFRPISKMILTTDPKSAELAKLCTNMLRYVQFAIANEFMILADSHDRDFYEIQRLVNTEYPRGNLKSCGLVGGTCLPKDFWYISEKEPFIELGMVAWKINETIPMYLVNKINKLVDLHDKKVALFGMTYKAQTDDWRESLSFKLRKKLQFIGAKVESHDPYICKTSIEDTLKKSDVIFISTNHDEYYSEQFKESIKKLANKECIVCDIWNVFKTNKIIFRVENL